MKIATILMLALVLILPAGVFATDCPYGEVDCEGRCGLFTDQNNDGICDLSQEDTSAITEETLDEHLISGQEIKTKTVQEVAAIYRVDAVEFAFALSSYYRADINPTDSFALLHDNLGVSPSLVKDMAGNLAVGNDDSAAASALTDDNSGGNQNKQRNKSIYNFLPLSITLIILYILSLMLAKFKVWTIVSHRKSWNAVLTVSFLLSGVSGIFLILKVNYGWVLGWPFNLLYWHVETGLVMAMVSVFHIVWHWPYFKSMLKSSKSQS